MKTKEINQSEKTILEAMAELRIEENKEFQSHFNELYTKLDARFNSEYKYINFNDKVELLESFISQINEVLQIVNNKSLSELSEKNIDILKSKRGIYEKILNDLYLNNGKVSNKSSKEDNSKKDFKDLVNKSYNWNDNEIETLKRELLDKFQKDINKAYNKGGKGSKELFNYVIAYLIKNKIIDEENFKFTECVQVFEKLFFDQKVENFYPNFVKFKKEIKEKTGLEINKLNTTNYTKVFKPKISQILNNHTFLSNRFAVD